MNRVCFTLLWIVTALICGSWLIQADESFAAGNDRQLQQRQTVRKPILALWPTEVRGIGTDIDRAKKNAFGEAQKAVVKFLRSQNPPLQYWLPTQQDVAELLADNGNAGPDAKLLPGDEPMKTWVLRFDGLDAKKFAEFQRLDQHAKQIHDAEQRRQRIEERTILAGKIFLICLFFLIGCLGYARMQEWAKKSVVARWLPVAVTGGVICLIAGLWFF